MYTSRSVMHRVPYDGHIRHKALTHRFSAKDDISVMFAWTFVLLRCAGMCACVSMYVCTFLIHKKDSYWEFSYSFEPLNCTVINFNLT